MRHLSSGWLISSVALLHAVIGVGPRAYAQAEGEPEEDQPIVRRRAVFVSDQQFDQWFFGREGGADKARHALEADLLERIRSNGFSHYLTAEQEKKLELAGMRDIQRFFDGVREKREMLDRVAEDRGQVRAILLDLQTSRRNPLGDRVFNEKSLYAKILDKTLRSENVHAGNQAFYRSRVDRVVSGWDRELDLSSKQHDLLVELIAQETPALKRYHGEYEAIAVTFQAARLPKGRFERILEGFQVQRLEQKFRDATPRGPILIAKGFVEVGDPDNQSTAEVNPQEREKRQVPFAQPGVQDRRIRVEQ